MKTRYLIFFLVISFGLARNFFCCVDQNNLKQEIFFKDDFQETESIYALSDFLKSDRLVTEYGVNIPTTIQTIQNKVKTVIFFCPVTITGGVEAICQLAHELKKLGYDAYIVWSVLGSDFSNIYKKYKNNRWYLCGQTDDIGPLVYQQKYQVCPLEKDVLLDDSTLIVIPEISFDIAPFFETAQKAFLWLSILNFQGSPGSKWIKEVIAQNKLNSLGYIHFSDAPWISKILLKACIASYPLQAPIGLEYFSERKIKKNEKTIAYSPIKGKVLADKFISLNDKYNYIPLIYLDKQGMLNALDSAKIYIDFGHFPGKDRIPREAIMRDCVVFIHNVNCARDFESFPMDDFFKFYEEDIDNGVLAHKVAMVLDSYEEMHNKQNFIRESIYQEQTIFEEEVKAIFQKKQL